MGSPTKKKLRAPVFSPSETSAMSLSVAKSARYASSNASAGARRNRDLHGRPT
jgi:hypothetical protein